MSVRMSHDGIEDEITVPDVSVPVYERSGWKVVDRPPSEIPADRRPTTPKETG